MCRCSCKLNISLVGDDVPLLSYHNYSINNPVKHNYLHYKTSLFLQTWLLVSRKAINKRSGYKYNRRKEQLILKEIFPLHDVNILIWSITFSNMAWSRLNCKICCLNNCITYNKFLDYLKWILFLKRSTYDYFNFLKKCRSEYFEFSDLSSLSHNVIYCSILTVYTFFIITAFFFLWGVMMSLN